jgi:hypothetical protein
VLDGAEPHAGSAGAAPVASGRPQRPPSRQKRPTKQASLFSEVRGV